MEYPRAAQRDGLHAGLPDLTMSKDKRLSYEVKHCIACGRGPILFPFGRVGEGWLCGGCAREVSK